MAWAFGPHGDAVHDAKRAKADHLRRERRESPYPNPISRPTPCTINATTQATAS